MAMRPPWRSSSSSIGIPKPRARTPARYRISRRLRALRPRLPEAGPKRGSARLRHLIAILLFAVAVLAGGAPGASAQAVPRSEAQITFSFAPVVKQVAPAVVNIYTRKVVESRAASPFFNDPFFQQF